ncbi:MAG TPA: transporter [Verrucomicrobiae bacterium]|nr:transporter [Verrucomicrobiae bacterium]
MEPNSSGAYWSERLAKPSTRTVSRASLGRLAVTCVALCSAGLAPAHAELGAAPASKPQDLTGLSLEDLLHEDITPINVLGSHTHLKGGFMVGYRYMYMDMAHNQDGTRDVSQQEVLSQYPVVHTTMTMQMHMAELMYAPTEWATVMAMVPYADNEMHHLTRTGERPTTYSSGLGDLSFMGLFNLWGNPSAPTGQRLVLNAGFTAPTGAIDESSAGKPLEYMMQLGSGTWDLNPGLTYLGDSDLFSWGAQVLGTTRFGRNDHGYRLGDRYRLSAWADVKVTDWFGPSVRLDWHAWDKIHGADPGMNPARNPAFDATKQYGERLDLLFGLNFYVPSGFLKGNRFSLEGGVPVYQNIGGPTIGVDWLLTVAWNYTFR